MPTEREYLFIDGGCLRSSVQAICRDLFGDQEAYAPHVAGLASAGTFAKVFYYDAVPGKAHNETQAAYEARTQVDYERFDRIQALDRVHVALGKIVGKDRRQKGVDVRLAVDMMTHAFRGTISRATLFAGDADFVPLLKALVAEGLHVTLWHPAQANAELKGAADSVKEFSFKEHHQCFTSDGDHAAFGSSSSGSGGGMEPANDGLTTSVQSGKLEFAGYFRGDILKIWRRPAGQQGSWSYTNFRALGATPERALLAFDLIYGWGLARLPAGWVEA